MGYNRDTFIRLGVYVVYVMTTQTQAVRRAYNAAELKASDVRDECGPAPIDHAAQAALENTDLTGEAFNQAYAEVFTTVNDLVEAHGPCEAANKIQRLKYELA